MKRKQKLLLELALTKLFREVYDDLDYDVPKAIDLIVNFAKPLSEVLNEHVK